MGAAEQRQKDSAMASNLKASGYPHGRRKGSANRNSGGLANDRKAVGSAAYQRRVANKGNA